jgi:hypothetical protein
MHRVLREHIEGAEELVDARHGRVRVFFLQANASAEAPILRYGRTYRGFGIRCTSRMSGLRCANRSGHGFTLSRERQRTLSD